MAYAPAVVTSDRCAVPFLWASGRNIRRIVTSLILSSVSVIRCAVVLGAATSVLIVVHEVPELLLQIHQLLSYRGVDLCSGCGLCRGVRTIRLLK